MKYKIGDILIIDYGDGKSREVNGYMGEVVNIDGFHYVLDMGADLGFTHTCSGIFDEPIGYYINDENCKLFKKGGVMMSKDVQISKVTMRAIDEITDLIHYTDFSADRIMDEVKEICKQHTAKVDGINTARPFQIGDIITGTEEARDSYAITTSKALMEVVGLDDGGYISVVVKSHKDDFYAKTAVNGREYNVREEAFKLAEWE